MTERRSENPIFARFYAWLSTTMERNGMADNRRRLLSGLRGEVVEIGAGNGLNFGYYPEAVTRVVAVEPDAHLRALARREAEKASVPIEVVDGVADRLPGPDHAFDAAVLSLVLCTVPDPGRALAEARRVLRPGGALHFFEHVRAETKGLERVQRFSDATFWPYFAGGCRTSRDSVAAIEAAGFQIDRLNRFRFPDYRISLPITPMVMGSAIRPAGQPSDAGPSPV